jgi:hypothetical protein
MEGHWRSCANQRGDTTELERSDGDEPHQRLAKQGCLVCGPTAVVDMWVAQLQNPQGAAGCDRGRVRHR